jgi:ribosomal-protein-alanine N-acetyltransferase
MNSPATAVRIRRMSVADLERVLEIAEGLPLAPHWPASAYVAAMDLKNLPQRVALVAERAAKEERDSSESWAVVGFVLAVAIPPEAELETIAVAAEVQRRGLGGLLMRALVDELKTAQVSELNLEVRASNRMALRFYRRQAFEEAGRRPRYYADPEEDAVLMRLSLA